MKGQLTRVMLGTTRLCSDMYTRLRSGLQPNSSVSPGMLITADRLDRTRQVIAVVSLSLAKRLVSGVAWRPWAQRWS